MKFIYVIGHDTAAIIELIKRHTVNYLNIHYYMDYYLVLTEVYLHHRREPVPYIIDISV